MEREEIRYGKDMKKLKYSYKEQQMGGKYGTVGEKYGTVGKNKWRQKCIPLTSWGKKYKKDDGKEKRKGEKGGKRNGKRIEIGNISMRGKKYVYAGENGDKLI